MKTVFKLNDMRGAQYILHGKLFESKFIYPYIKGNDKTFLRFIDDFPMIWTGSEEEEPLKFINEVKLICSMKLHIWGKREFIKTLQLLHIT